MLATHTCTDVRPEECTHSPQVLALSTHESAQNPANTLRFHYLTAVPEGEGAFGKVSSLEQLP